ncbi:MAG: Gfo/Idh/MocA family oxidoreductase [Acidobacteria bacterium]|nr:Gfo/Idh/MocA family oxidoreductase [Acidobacteriota bacterium]
MNIGVIGYGYWGPNLVRNFSEVPDAQVVAVSDLDEQRLRLVKARYPAIAITTDHETLLSNRDIDAIVIATPVASHYAIALQALSLKKHVFIEKPLTQTAAQGERLIEEADKHNLTLHVDHTFVYTGAVRKIRSLVSDGEVGELYYYDSVRVSLGLFRPDVNVIWDLAVHDLSIMDYVFPFSPIAVSATGVSHVPGEPANIAYLTLFFENDAIAHLHVNWLAPVKIRRTLIGGNRKMIIYDDLEPSEKVKVYDKGITVNGSKESMYDVMIGYRTGDVWAPKLEVTEAILAEARYFIRCITHGERSITDGRAGLRVVRILEAATQSMNTRGRPIELNFNGC